MVLMDGSAGYQQPCYSSYINLRNMGHSSNNNNNHNDNAVSCVLPSSEEFGYKSVLQRRNRTLVFGCRHFPAVEVQTKANWSCEFCHGAKLIEQASRSNEAVSSLDIDKLLCNYSTMREGMGETTCTRNAMESAYNKMGSWILRTRARDTPAN